MGALIANEAAQQSRERSSQPRNRASKPHSSDQARELAHCRKEQQHAEDDVETAVAGQAVQDCPDQTSGGARSTRTRTTDACMSFASLAAGSNTVFETPDPSYETRIDTLPAVIAASRLDSIPAVQED